VRRYLEFKGFAVRHVMNITDVEDKIITRVREAQVPLRDYTTKYEAAFFEDLEALGCLRAHQTPHATDHIPEMIALIEKLLARGIAYRTADGSVYFSIEKYRGCGGEYGQLVKLDFDAMRPGERVSSDDYAKESVADFALWKARLPEDGAVFWASPWGEGRPGWHIECSAMSMKLLGPSFDLHLGGEDLIFPHHEDEIAQSEGAALQQPGQPFVKFWMHGAHLLVEGKKMSKSLGNFYTLRDLLAKGFNGREVRYLLLTAHYRESFNFTLIGLSGARSALGRLEECLSKLPEIAGQITAAPDEGVLMKFSEAMDDDLNVSAAWGSIFGWVSELNRLMKDDQLTPNRAAAAISTWEKLNSVLGLRVPRIIDGSVSLPASFGLQASLEVIPAEVSGLLEQRQAARKAKDFKRADAIREELKAKGWVIEDTPKGARLKRV
jgi:cysteinyl-tRNA synthetase